MAALTTVRAAVLDLTSSLHNWRRDPSPENTRAVMIAGDVLSGHALELERQVEQSEARARCESCGHSFYLHEKGGCDGSEKNQGVGYQGPCRCIGYTAAPYA